MKNVAVIPKPVIDEALSYYYEITVYFKTIFNTWVTYILKCRKHLSQGLN
jgi:hypothetical protein